MSPKISLWAGLIGITATIPLVQSISIAKTSVEIGETARAITPIPQNTTSKADDYIALAGQKYGKGDYRGSLAEYNRAIQLDPNYDRDIFFTHLPKILWQQILLLQQLAIASAST